VWNEERIFGRVERNAVVRKEINVRKYVRCWPSHCHSFTQVGNSYLCSRITQKAWLAGWPSLLSSSCKFSCRLWQEYVVT